MPVPASRTLHHEKVGLGYACEKIRSQIPRPVPHPPNHAPHLFRSASPAARAPEAAPNLVRAAVVGQGTVRNGDLRASAGCPAVLAGELTPDTRNGAGFTRAVASSLAAACYQNSESSNPVPSARAASVSQLGVRCAPRQSEQ